MTWDEAVRQVEQMVTMREGTRLMRAHEEATALRLLLSHAIPREDRERALDMHERGIQVWHGSEPVTGTIQATDLSRQYRAEARRLLKLEVEP